MDKDTLRSINDKFSVIARSDAIDPKFQFISYPHLDLSEASYLSDRDGLVWLAHMYYGDKAMLIDRSHFVMQPNIWTDPKSLKDAGVMVVEYSQPDFFEVIFSAIKERCAELKSTGFRNAIELSRTCRECPSMSLKNWGAAQS